MSCVDAFNRVTQCPILPTPVGICGTETLSWFKIVVEMDNTTFVLMPNHHLPRFGHNFNRGQGVNEA